MGELTPLFSDSASSTEHVSVGLRSIPSTARLYPQLRTTAPNPRYTPYVYIGAAAATCSSLSNESAEHGPLGFNIPSLLQNGVKTLQELGASGLELLS